MTNKIEISRELAERLTKDYTGRPNWDALEEDRLAATEELRALLAAPAVDLSDYLASCKSAHMGLTIDQVESVEKGIDDLLFGSAPAIERQEPVGFRYRAHGGHWEWMDESPFADGREHYKLGGEELQPLYTSPPAPVEVVLPEHRDVRFGIDTERSYKLGWNACLDKVKEMNQCS